MKKSIAISLVSALALFYTTAQADLPGTPTKDYTIAENLKAAYLGTYKGTLPCADCQGIEIELLLQEGGKSKSKTFILKQKYLGKPANQSTFTVTGKWFMAIGNKQNPNAKILQLIPDGKEDLLYFEYLKDGSIKLLGKNQQPINTKLNYILKKQRS